MSTQNATVVNKASSENKITVENVNVPGHTNRLDATKYQAMRQAMLQALPLQAPGLTQGEMIEAVKRYLPADLFPGGAKVGWWAKSVQLDLEAKKVIVRENSKPLRWHRLS
jgi:hypothetical protein